MDGGRWRQSTSATRRANQQNLSSPLALRNVTSAGRDAVDAEALSDEGR